MNPETVKKIGAVVGVVGGIAADIALTTILKSSAPAVTGKLNKAILAAGIGFMGYAAGSAVTMCVQKDTNDIAKQVEETQNNINKMMDDARDAVQNVFVVDAVDIPVDNN